MLSLTAELNRIRRSSFARSIGWMLTGQGLSFVLQLAYFIILARLLGVREYGVLAGAIAFVGIVMPYSALGSGVVFMRYVSSGQGEPHTYWGNILISTVTVGTGLTVLLYLLAPHFLNSASASIVLLVALGNCLFSQLSAAMSQIFQTFDLMGRMAFLSLLTNGLRLVAVVIMSLVLHQASAHAWAAASLFVSILAAVLGVITVILLLGPPRYVFQISGKRAAEGLGFSLGSSAQSIYNDIDKSMLSHYGLNVENGIYTMAYRIIDIATMPITAVDAAALPRYFRGSKEGVASVIALSTRLAKRTGLLGIFLSVALFFTAPVIPHIVGQGYRESILALRWLCLIPTFRGIHQLTGSAIAGMGFQRYRTVTQFAAATLNFGLNLWLIPLRGWHGAAWASIATDGMLGIANWVILRRVVPRKTRNL